MCACVKVARVCVCEGCRACVHADGREVSLHRSADKYTCFSLLNAFRLFTRTAVALCKHIYTSAGVFQAVAYSDLTEEDTLTFLVVDLHLGPMPPSDQAHADLTEEDALTFLVVELHLARCPPQTKPMRISQRKMR